MSEARLRVVSYNVHGQEDDRGALISVVRTLAPDVLIVQEGPRRFRWRTRCADLAHSVGMIYAAGGLPSLGNVVMTNQRVRVHETWCLRYPLTPGRHMRGAAFARCSVGRTGFAVAGSHLATDDAERPSQAGLLKTTMAGVDVPMILGADLNETSGGSAWRMLAEGLVDAGAAMGAADTGTYSVRNPSRRIDVIFADPACAVRRYEVVDTPASRTASDHFPIVVDLVLPA